jgi:uncharacterized protein YgbK (DUF1537 family)
MGILIVAGSPMPQTAAQIEHLEQKGTPCFILDLLQLFDPAQREAHIASLCAEISTDLRIGNDVIFHSPNDLHALEHLKES